jgi:hypothetical protein
MGREGEVKAVRNKKPNSSGLGSFCNTCETLTERHRLMASISKLRKLIKYVRKMISKLTEIDIHTILVGERQADGYCTLCQGCKGQEACPNCKIILCVDCM